MRPYMMLCVACTQTEAFRLEDENDPDSDWLCALCGDDPIKITEKEACEMAGVEVAK